MSKRDDKFNADTAMKVLKGIGFAILGIGAMFLFGLVIMLLWNWLMPAIFGLPAITYWQGIGLLILSSILFGRMGGGSSEGKKKDKKRSHYIKDEIKEEIKKEFEKKYGKCEDDEENSEQEKMYEQWWEAEGKDSFEKYLKREEEEK